MDPIHNKEISVGDLVKEHTKSSKKRVGLVHEVISNCYLNIKWLDGSSDYPHCGHRNKYEVTRFINGEYKDILQEYIQQGKRLVKTYDK